MFFFLFFLPALSQATIFPPSGDTIEPRIDILLPFSGAPQLEPGETPTIPGDFSKVESVHRAASPTPTVTFKDGTVIGFTDSGIEAFRGIPFAEPPLGNLRFKRPVPLAKPFGTIQATAVAKGCPQFVANYNASSIPMHLLGSLSNSPLLQAAIYSGEDCLTVTVQRPAGTAASSKLPVLAWIFGGGFELGATNQYSGYGIVNKSMSLGKPVIFVAIAYRVGGWGFMPGKEMQAEGSTNVGLRDQRLGLEWIQDNIAAFGGDPKKVTIWGESAGAISVFDQLVINGGNHMYKNTPLFRAAIMNSGTAVPVQDYSHPKPQKIYDTAVKAAKCDTAKDSLACLRAMPYNALLRALASVPAIVGYESVDLSYLPRPDSRDNFFPVSPEVAGLVGKFAKVPVIIGDQEDEGTLFALFQSNLSTTAHVIDYLTPYFPSAKRSILEQLVSTYPDDQSAGSPFGTGTANSWYYPQFKRLSAILGDLTFTLTRRAVLAAASDKVNTWSYLSTYFHGTRIFGTAHGTDLLKLFFQVGEPFPRDAMWTYYISFIYDLDPNTIRTTETTLQWPKWKNNTRKLLSFNPKNSTIINDDFRSKTYDFMLTIIEQLRV